tara:strand:- start:3 stop:161 length:159 start_codon:yes stop_codon:yes gene_type:complete
MEKDKEALREKIAKDTEKFLASGKVIKVCPSGEFVRGLNWEYSRKLRLKQDA